MVSLDPYAGFIWFVYIVIFLVYFLMISIAMALAVAQYVLQSLGLRSMLKSLGFEKTWYAFVPFCNSYAIGYIADKYDDGKPKTNYAKKLFRLSIATAVLFLPILFIIIVIAIMSAAYGDTGVGLAFALLLVFGSYIALIVLAVIYSVNLIKALWRIYRIFAPEKSILFLMLSIFVSPAMSIIFFIIRNRRPQNVRVEGFDSDGTAYTDN